MTPLPMLSNILGQPASLEQVLALHAGPGQPDLRACARVLAGCSGRIILAGMGASFFAALPAAQAFETAGHPVLHAEASELLHFGQGSWRPGDVAILISRSGASVETLELASLFTRDAIPFLAVTNVPGSPLTAQARATLAVGAAIDEIIAVQTYTGTLTALLLLAEQVCSPGNSTLAQQTLALLPNLTQHIERSLLASEVWQEFLLGPGPLYLLGRGSALASLHGGALLFHETAKAPAIAMSSGQFRHGPVEVVSPAFRAIVFGSPAATRAVDWQLALDLRTMGADVRWLGPHIDGQLPTGTPQLQALTPWTEDLPSALLPLFDIVPLQIAAYRTALWRGLRPGHFRYAPEVTDKETGFALLQASVAE